MRTPWARVALGLALALGGAGVVGRVAGRGGPLYAVATHALLMRWGLYVLRAVPHRPPGGWFQVRPWEAPLYRRLGVLEYRRLLRWAGWERYRRGATGFTGRRDSLAAYAAASREAEFSHLLLAAIGAGLVGRALRRRAWREAGWLLACNVFFQVYPVLLQRTMRARIAPLLARGQDRAE